MPAAVAVAQEPYTMPRSILRLTLTLSLLAITASVATAAPASISDHGAAIRILLGQLFPDWLGKNGCTFDPDGRCIPAAPAGKVGCSFDPNGCTGKPVDKNGCSYDPNGRCIPNP
jgi:hypothetical protein